MAKTAVAKVPTPAEIQRALEAKYKVVPSPWWIELAGQGILIDGVLASVGTELVFKGEITGITCGAGVIASPGLMRFSYPYGNDSYETRRSGRITGLTSKGNPLQDSPNEAVRIFDGKSGLEYDYHPRIFFYGSWARYFLTELWTLKK